MTPTLTLAVIGHVNHGKSALVRALTGTQTDRLREEIERGLSITLGFASRNYPSGIVDLIDAPGHEDFIRAMVSGATGVRAVLLVVSATEGFGRQTYEHLRIAGLLGVRAGIVVIAKTDLLDPDDAPAVLAATRASLNGTFLSGEPIILCSAVTGAGLSELDAALAALAGRAPAAEILPGAFLPIDRSFSIAGAGTIVTGTLQGWSLTPGAEMMLQPSGRRVTIRQLQSHGEPVDEAHPGGRVAVGLRGVSVDDIPTGEALCAPGQFEATLQVDVELSLSADSPRRLKHLEDLRVMWGARQDIGAVRLIGAASLAPGERALAQLRFAAPVIAFAGQRAVLRRLSPAQTLGGAQVLDAQARPYRGRAPQRLAVLEAAAQGDPDQIIAALARRDGDVVSVVELARLCRRPAPEIRERLETTFEPLDAGRWVRRKAVADARAAYLTRLTQAHLDAPMRLNVPVSSIRDALMRQVSRELLAHVERRLAEAGDIRLSASQVARYDHNPLATLPPGTLAQLARIEVRLRDGGLMPPEVTALADEGPGTPELIQLLVDTGRALSLRNHALRQTLVFHSTVFDAAATRLRETFPPPASFTTGQARAALATTRKFIVPVLEHLDTLGATAREGDLRRVLG